MAHKLLDQGKLGIQQRVGKPVSKLASKSALWIYCLRSAVSTLVPTVTNVVNANPDRKQSICAGPGGGRILRGKVGQELIDLILQTEDRRGVRRDQSGIDSCATISEVVGKE